MAKDDPGFTPEQAEQATQAQRDDTTVGTGPNADAMAGRVAVAAPAEVDVQALLARVQAMEKKLAEAGYSGGQHPLTGTAVSARDQLRVHLEHGNLTGSDEHAAVLRLADDLVDAAGNAVESGDVSAVRDIGARLERALGRIHPGNGDHHYFRQALEFVRHHLPEAADLVTAPAPSDRPQVASGRPPARVVTGSVTG
jgi:hypothetical protein